MSHTRFRTAATALAGILIAIGGCTESPSSPAQRQFILRGEHARFSVSGTTSAVIDERGGSLVSVAGDRIVFPAGALAGPTQISITADPQYVGVELEPHGLHFPAGAQPVLTLNTTGSDAGRYPGVDVAYVDEAGQVSEILPAANGTGALSTNLQHFSGYLAISH